MLIDELKAAAKQAMLSKDAVRRDILRLAVSEISSKQALGELSEEQAQKLVRKIVSGNEETEAALARRDTPEDREKAAQLRLENEILGEFLPKAWDAAALDAFLGDAQGLLDKIRAAPNDGAATGVAMKALKAEGAVVDGRMVGERVKAARAES